MSKPAPGGRGLRDRSRSTAPVVAGWFSLLRVRQPGSLAVGPVALLRVLAAIEAQVGRPPEGFNRFGGRAFDAVLWTARRPSGDTIAAWGKLGLDLFDVGPAYEDVPKIAHAIRESELLTPTGGRTE